MFAKIFSTLVLIITLLAGYIWCIAKVLKPTPTFTETVATFFILLFGCIGVAMFLVFLLARIWGIKEE